MSELFPAVWKQITSSPRHLKCYEQAVAALDTDTCAFLELRTDLGVSLAEPAVKEYGSLSGIPFAVKDNIAVKGFQFSCGSQILAGLRSPYTATAVERLLHAGAVPIGKTNLDEFGMGSSNQNSACKPTVNPWDLSRVPGGSSGGSAAAVSAGYVPFALGSDTGGSVRQPAAFCGIFGFKPTYGTVSRYGLAAYASSLETIGFMTAQAEQLIPIFEAASGADGRDQTSLDCSDTTDLTEGIQTVAVLAGDLGLDAPVLRGYSKAIEAFRSLGWNIVEVKLPSLDYAVPSYYTIASAEASANLARYTGVRYGSRSREEHDHQHMVRRTRDEGFGKEVKLRILLGTYVLREGFQDQYYVQAQKIRTLIRNEFSKLFTKAGVLLLPTFPIQAFPIGDGGLNSMQQKLADRFTLPANLAGLPAVSFPTGIESGLPVGMQLMGPAMSDRSLIRLTAHVSRCFPEVALPRRFSPGEVTHG